MYIVGVDVYIDGGILLDTVIYAYVCMTTLYALLEMDISSNARL